MFLINGILVLRNKLYFNKIMDIYFGKDKIYENFVKIDTKIRANSFKNTLSKI